MKSFGGAFETVLVVDDDGLTRKNAARAISRLGRRAVTAALPSEALEILQRDRVELAVIDVVLRGESGIDLLRRVRREYPDVIAVAISGFSHAELVQRAYRAGAHDFFEKPFLWPQLVEAIERGHTVEHRADEIPSIDTVTREYYKRAARGSRRQRHAGREASAYPPDDAPAHRPPGRSR